MCFIILVFFETRMIILVTWMIILFLTARPGFWWSRWWGGWFLVLDLIHAVAKPLWVHPFRRRVYSVTFSIIF